uniref:Thiol methyltransferase 1A n=1 Tax=Ornithorhynchus anatinus TaxID=9258 RepID=A0A6I8N710_ORNAN
MGQLLGLWAPLCKRYFPHFLRRFTALYNEQMAGPKRELFGGLEARARTPGRLALLDLAEHRQVRVERFVVSAGERMAQVDDASMDVVVCTLVLCSVRSQEDILREVFRVLRPGGAFYFLEHVAAEPNTWTAFWQQVLAPTWQLIFDGCDLTRETWKPLERAGFSRLQLQRMQAPLSWKIVRPHIMGFAVK